MVLQAFPAAPDADSQGFRCQVVQGVGAPPRAACTAFCIGGPRDLQPQLFSVARQRQCPFFGSRVQVFSKELGIVYGSELEQSRLGKNCRATPRSSATVSVAQAP